MTEEEYMVTEEAIEICKARQRCRDDIGWPIKQKYYDAETGRSRDAVRLAFKTARAFMSSISIRDLTIMDFTHPSPWICAEAVLSVSLCA